MLFNSILTKEHYKLRADPRALFYFFNFVSRLYAVFCSYKTVPQKCDFKRLKQAPKKPLFPRFFSSFSASNPVASTTWQGQPRRSFTDLRGSFFARSNEPCVDDHKKARWELAHIRAFLWLATYGERRDSHELPRSEVTCRQGSLHYKVSHAWTGWQSG